MPFEVTPETHIRRDDDDFVRQIRHLQEPYQAATPVAPTPQLLARAYLEDLVDILDFDPDVLTTVGENISDAAPSDEGSRLRFSEEKAVGNTQVVSYVQTYRGIPVFRAGASVVIDRVPRQVISMANEFRYDVDVEPPDEDAKYTPDKTANIRRLIGRLLEAGDGKLTQLTSTKLVIYRYDPVRRIDVELDVEEDEAEEAEVGATAVRSGYRSMTSLRPHGAIAGQPIPGKWYVATEVVFTASLPPWPVLHFRMLTTADTGMLLYLQPGVSGIDGQVFRYDPQSQAADATINPCSPPATLNAWRETVSLQGLTAPDPGDDQELTGNRVSLGEQASPTVAPPAESSGTDFLYSATTDDFAAVNAYWHIDEMLRFIDDMPGLSIATYFNNTSFPVTVDHRDASLGTVNARAYANSGMDGSGGFGFNLAQSGCTVGIAADSRIAWHEVCHALLLENVDGFNFGFAHSAGDSLGVILSDWAAPSVDRFDTFPFNTINRRHDRDVTAGWAWGGSNDDSSYGSESILATTLFRFYRSIGGDSPHQSQRRLAAEHAAYLIIGAIGTLTPATNPANPDGYATALMDFDKGNDYGGISRGALHKVVRWAFEQQGLYQPPGAPTPVVSVGVPPEVDVYIDDGRNGTYEYQYNFWNSTDMWNRLSGDGGTAHQTPVTGQTNYMYVKVRNRGTATATNVSVSGYSCEPGTGLVWPDDWAAMSPASVAGSDIPPGGVVTVGPFEWTPMTVGHECILAIASATGDQANDTTVTGSIPHGRFVPFDNNIGQRNVAPVAGGGGASALVASFADRRFLFRNPFDETVGAELEVHLPSFLADRGWTLQFRNPGGRSFTLGPLSSREIVMEMEAGDDFGPGDIPGDPSERAVEVVAVTDGLVVGGMNYDVDPTVREPPHERPEKDKGRGCEAPSQELLECLGLPDLCVDRASIKSVIVEIRIDDCC